MRFKNLAALSFVSLMAAACGGGATGATPKPLSPENQSGKMDAHGRAVSKEAAASFDRALDEFAAHDKAQDWNADTCKSVAQSFEQASGSQKSATNRDLPEALYNEGLAHQRCGDSANAKEAFDRAVAADPAFHRAKAQLALFEYQKSGDLDSTIDKLDQIIRDAKFQNVEGLVSLAALQMQRGNDQPNQDGKDDLERARKNLQRALAIDDSYMPALNQLAIYYLEQAKAKAGEKKRVVGKRRGRGLVVSGGKKAVVNEQQLDLAALVAGQAIKKNPNYAPIHNTSGLILVELRNYNQAVQEFGKAAKLDPNFFEAHMNYAAVNLSFRGFQEAERAYRQALKLHPDEFEAHLGLALAIRGQIMPGSGDKQVADAQKELDAAKKLAPDRPEPYYNEAILTQEFRAKQGDQAIPMLEKAADQYKAFIAKAGEDAVFAEAVKRSSERTKDIQDTVKFIKEGVEAKRQQDELNAQAAKDKAAGKTPPPAAGDKGGKGDDQGDQGGDDKGDDKGDTKGDTKGSTKGK